MSSNNVQFQQPQQINAASAHPCKECGRCFNSAESLDVHVQYHNENLLTKWANKAATSQEETNNNNTKTGVKREFIPNSTIAAPADSSDSMNKKSPDYSRATPETIFGQPPTPQSYQSAASPYQSNPENNAPFSPAYQNYAMKQERTSPNSHHPYPNSYAGFEPQFYPIEQNQQQQQYSQQDFQMHKVPVQNASYRYHPYAYERQQQVTSSSPAYPPQPTPSPSPKQCDKCGYVCDSASQLLEHQNLAHPPTPHMAAGYHHNPFMYGDAQPPVIKSEEDAQSEILDLDSHKVHQIYPEDEKRQNGDLVQNPHSVSALLNSWPQQPQQQQKIYGQYMNGPPVQQEQKLFIHNPDFMASSVTTTTPETMQGYRAFEHIQQQQQQQPSPAGISSSQVTTNPTPTSAPPSTKSANWKSNEARRPKTYNCTACNKWFTSSGHLKRHYNTTLHKNAVKSSGQPDPASMPISAHHHPARESSTNKEDSSPGDEDAVAAAAAMMQSPPNGEAGPSPTTPSLDSRGLLLNSTHGFNLAPMMPIDNSHQFQMYPNGSAPHVTQVTDISSLSITGEFGQEAVDHRQETQPLPSFAQFQRYGGLLVGYGDANVGGGGTVTTPYLFYPDPAETAEARTLPYRTDEDDYRLTQMTAADPASPVQDELSLYSHYDLPSPQPPPSPEKAHTQRDYEEPTGSPRITSSTSAQQDNNNRKPGQYRCNACDKTFNKACYMTQHNKTFHSGDKPFKCDRCGKRFSDEGAHSRHASKHAGEKPHKCDRCPKQFNHKTDLRRHMCLHSGHKPFVCDTCGKGFIRKDHMLKHGETHFKKTHAKKQ